MGRGNLRTAHTVAFEHYIGQIPGGMGVCHTCDNPPCVNPSHLFLGTQADNLADMKAKGRHARGSTQGHAKLTDYDVIAIRQLYQEGFSQRMLARAFGVVEGTISKITLRKRWQHIP